MKKLHGILLILGFLTGAAAGPCEAESSFYRSNGKRDPFVPLITPEGQRIYPPGTDEGGVANLMLQGIVFEPQGESYAVINGRIVREGEEVDGVKVLKIAPSAVVIQSEGQQHQLSVRQAPEGE